MKYGTTATGIVLHLWGLDDRSLCGKALVSKRGRLLVGESLCEHCARAARVLRATAAKRAALVERREESAHQSRVLARGRTALEELREGVQIAASRGMIADPSPEWGLLRPGHVVSRLGVYRGTPT